MKIKDLLKVVISSDAKIVKRDTHEHLYEGYLCDNNLLPSLKDRKVVSIYNAKEYLYITVE